MNVDQNDNEIVDLETNDSNLDSFAEEFFGQTTSAPDPGQGSESDEEEQNQEDADNETRDTDTPAPEDDEDDSDEQGDEDEEEDPGDDDPKPVNKKKNSAQERINELNKKFREEERQRKALEEKLNKLLEEREPTNKETTKAPVNNANDGPKPPSPTDKNEDGSDKYPLGEFDPNFINDSVDFRLEQKLAQQVKEQERTREEQKLEEQRLALEKNWQARLDETVKEYPDFGEKVGTLEDVMGDVPEAYGQYLAAALMALDKGPEVLYYLANNPEEARQIIDSGATKATIALGRIESRFIAQEKEDKASVKPSNAPTPPPRNKGSAAAKASVPVDTDDLEAFSRMLFKK